MASRVFTIIFGLVLLASANSLQSAGLRALLHSGEMNKSTSDTTGTYIPKGQPPSWDAKSGEICKESHICSETVGHSSACAEACNTYNPIVDTQPVSCQTWVFDNSSGECKLYSACTVESASSSDYMLGSYSDADECTYPGNSYCSHWYCDNEEVFANGCGACSCVDACTGEGTANTGSDNWYC